MKLKKVVIDGKDYYEIDPKQLKAISLLPEDFNGDIIKNALKNSLNHCLDEYRRKYEEKFSWYRLDNKANITTAKKELNAALNKIDKTSFKVELNTEMTSKLIDIEEIVGSLKQTINKKLQALDTKLADIEVANNNKNAKANAKKFIQAFLLVNEQLDFTNEKLASQVGLLSEKELNTLMSRIKK